MDVGPAIDSALASGSMIALPLSLLGGLLVGLNPCCLALYPAAAASCCANAEYAPRMTRANALSFMLGVATAMAALGVAVALVGHVTSFGSAGRYLAATVPIVAGLSLLGWIALPVDRLLRIRISVGGAFSVGLVMSLVVGPCGTPLLASVLSYAAYQGKVLYGAMLLFVYGVGVAIPVVAAGSALGTLFQRIAAPVWKARINQASGLVLLAVGLYLIWTA